MLEYKINAVSKPGGIALSRAKNE
ncbi:hypothetical protein MNBD_BACTEROID07-1149, partial [hydrothermal vent metagenome]